MKTPHPSKAITNVMTSALVLAAANAVYGQDATKPEAPPAEPEKAGAEKFFTQDVPKWIKDGKFNLNVRLRWDIPPALRPSAQPSVAQYRFRRSCIPAAALSAIRRTPVGL